MLETAQTIRQRRLLTCLLQFSIFTTYSDVPFTARRRPANTARLSVPRSRKQAYWSVPSDQASSGDDGEFLMRGGDHRR